MRGRGRGGLTSRRRRSSVGVHRRVGVAVGVGSGGGGRRRRRRRGRRRRLGQPREHRREERLHLVVGEVERRLVRDERVVVAAVDEAAEDRGDARRVVEEHEALADLGPVGLGRRLGEAHEQPQHRVAERAVGDEALRDAQRVAEQRALVGAARDDGLEHVEAARLERDADRLLELARRDGRLNHALDDGDHARVDVDGLAALDLAAPQLKVVVEAARCFVGLVWFVCLFVFKGGREHVRTWAAAAVARLNSK